MRSEIREGINEAFTLRYQDIQNAAYSEWPDISVFDTDQIMAGLAVSLHKYRRPADERFMQWATAWVQRETKRYRFLVEMLGSYRRMLTAAIERSLYQSPGEDWAVELEDHIAELQLYLLENPRELDTILNPKRAKVSSMLYGFAKLRMWAYKSKIGDRKALTLKWLADLCDIPGLIAPPLERPDPYEKKVMRYELSGVR